jgi:hypothetical protein
MTTEPGLFEEPERLIPAEPPVLTRGERRQRLVATRIATGVHPLGKPVFLHKEACRDPLDTETGPRCGTCRFRKLLEYHNRTYPKCHYPDPEKLPHPRDSNCESSDIRRWWPACAQYEKVSV